MKKAFTIIELIFVIVIIGILIAVAIPKLNSTREDAKSVTIVTNLKHFLGDVASYYLANGEDRTANSKAWTAVTYDKVTDTIDRATASTVLTGSNDTSFYLDNINGSRCFELKEATKNIIKEGKTIQQRVIKILDGPDKNSIICQNALTLAEIKGLHAKNTTTEFIFAGQKVSY